MNIKTFALINAYTMESFTVKRFRQLFRIVVFLLFLNRGVYCRTGGGDSSGPSAYNYRAKRYGGYYSTRYFSYSGGGGYARYSRVYQGVHNYYTSYYNTLLRWLGSESFKVYKNTPSGSISVCRNYEANENGTYLGVFTCPLPFEPASHAYCCGFENAQYCCRFWDIPLNVLAAIICALMILGILATLIYIIIQLCINNAKLRADKKERILQQVVGKLQRRRRATQRRRSSPAFRVMRNNSMGSWSIISPSDVR